MFRLKVTIGEDEQHVHIAFKNKITLEVVEDNKTESHNGEPKIGELLNPFKKGTNHWATAEVMRKTPDITRTTVWVADQVKKHGLTWLPEHNASAYINNAIKRKQHFFKIDKTYIPYKISIRKENWKNSFTCEPSNFLAETGKDNF